MYIDCGPSWKKFESTLSKIWSIQNLGLLKVEQKNCPNKYKSALMIKQQHKIDQKI